MKITKNRKTIVIEPEKDINKTEKEGDFGCWYDKEIITLRISSRKLECYECGKEINKGKKYIRDKFIFKGTFYEKQFKVNFICLNCWKGEIPNEIATNRSLKENEENIQEE